MAEQDYQIKDLGPDDLYGLLPYVVRAGDPGLIRSYFAALTAQHNFLAGKLREMPRSQDPTQAAKFTPESVGESSALFSEWLFLKRVRTPSAAQLERISTLERSVPQSINLFHREALVLQALARTVGEQVENGLPAFALRPLLQTAIQRHHIKGSHASFELLGRIMGIFDLKVQELWTRFSLSNPANVSSPENDLDFATSPEQYPYWPADRNRYDGNMRVQWPPGSAEYNPFVLDDSPTPKTARFEYLVLDRRNVRFYNTVINGNNPFIALSGIVSSKIHPGVYTLSGGTDNAKASVTVPYTSGDGQVTFDAITFGTHGNSIQVTIQDDTSGTQTLIVDGPQSVIKYKSSAFDLVLGVDIDAFYAITAAIPVKLSDDDTVYDSVLGRTPPEYPVTGTPVGTRQISNPSTEFQMDLDAFNDSMTVLREMVEAMRPMTRTLRTRKVGLVINDLVRYAPYCAFQAVTLASPDGNKWDLYLNDGVPAWSLNPDSSTLANTVTQYDFGTGQWIEWRISNAGVFSAVASPDATPQDQIVFLPGGLRGGFIFVRNGIIQASGVYTEITETIHGDGTPDESLLRLDYTLFSEKPSQYSTPYMSEQAVFNQSPPPCLHFQQNPEDEVTSVRTILDFSKYHVAPHPGTEDRLDGDINANWWYDTDGQINGTDIRLRAAGIDTEAIEPVPTGDDAEQDGLTFGYPLQFLSFAGDYVYRDRVTNDPMTAYYTFDAPDEDTGPTLVTAALPNAGEGPTEGGTEPPDWDPLEALDAGQWDSSTDAPWCRYVNWEFTPIGDFTSVTNQSGKALVNGLNGGSLQRGATIHLETSYAGTWVVLEPGTDTLISAAYGSAGPAGHAWIRHASAITEGVGKFQLSISTASLGAGATNWVLWQSIGGTPSILDSGILAAGSSYQADYDTTGVEEVWLETTGTLSGFAELQFLAFPPSLDRTGFLMARGGERDDLLYFIIDPGQDWWEYSETGGVSPLDPLPGGEHWWRGGITHGTKTGVYTSRGAEMPDLLTLT